MRNSAPYNPAKQLELAVRGGTWWDFTQNATLTAASTNFLNSWQLFRLSRTGTGPWVYSESATTTASVYTDDPNHANVVIGPKTTTIVVKKSETGRRYCWVGTSYDVARFFDFNTGEWSGSITSGGTILKSLAINLGDGKWLLSVTFNPTNAASYPAFGFSATDGVFAYSTTSGTELATVWTPSVSELAQASMGLTGILTQIRASQLAPRIGAIGTLAQATATKQPFLWNGSAWSQSNGLYFNGAQNMAVSGSSISQPNSVCIATSQAATSAVYVFVDGSGAGRNQLYAWSTNNYFLYAGSSPLQGPSQTTARKILSATFNRANSSIRLNGSATAVSDVGSNAMSGCTVGSDTNGSGYLIGTITDVIVRQGYGYSASEWTIIERALGSYRSIAVL